MADLQKARYAARSAVSHWFEEPAATALTRIGFTASAATLSGLALACGAAYWAATGKFWVAGLFVIAGATFDMLDGGIARRTGTVTHRYFFLPSDDLLIHSRDSCVDRAPASASLD